MSTAGCVGLGALTTSLHARPTGMLEAHHRPIGICSGTRTAGSHPRTLYYCKGCGDHSISFVLRDHTMTIYEIRPLRVLLSSYKFVSRNTTVDVGCARELCRRTFLNNKNTELHA